MKVILPELHHTACGLCVNFNPTRICRYFYTKGIVRSNKNYFEPCLHGVSGWVVDEKPKRTIRRKVLH